MHPLQIGRLNRHPVPAANFGQIDGAVAQAERGTELVGDDVEISTGDFEEHFLFERNFVGHDGQQAMAARTGHAGKADARVAGGGLDEAATFRKFAALFKVSQQSPRGAVLHRTEGIHPFELREKREFRVGIQPIDTDKRRGVLLTRHHFKYVFVNSRLVIHRCNVLG